MSVLAKLALIYTPVQLNWQNEELNSNLSKEGL